MKTKGKKTKKISPWPSGLGHRGEHGAGGKGVTPPGGVAQGRTWGQVVLFEEYKLVFKSEIFRKTRGYMRFFCGEIKIPWSERRGCGYELNNENNILSSHMLPPLYCAQVPAPSGPKGQIWGALWGAIYKGKMGNKKSWEIFPLTLGSDGIENILFSGENNSFIVFTL